MGFQIHSANLLKYVSKERHHDSIVQIGRQSINLLPDSYLLNSFGILNRDEIGDFAEQLLMKYFHAKEVVSIDKTDYEGATFMMDLNSAIPELLSDKLKNTFDLVIDFGTLEHLYNVPQALFSISSICKENADIIHCLPANGWVGHGFYQFSPELFFSVYSEENGYAGTEVFLANCHDNKYWYRVKKPINGIRSCAEGDREAYVLVKTTKVSKECRHSDIQQSDWIIAWNRTQVESPEKTNDVMNRDFKSRVKITLSRFDVLVKLVRYLRETKRKYFRGYDKISGRNPSLTKLKVSELLG